MKKKLITIIALAAVTLSLTSCQTEETPESAVECFINAFNVNDTKSVVQCFTPDVQKKLNNNRSSLGMYFLNGPFNEYLRSGNYLTRDFAYTMEGHDLPQGKLSVKSTSRISDDLVRIDFSVDFKYGLLYGIKHAGRSKTVDFQADVQKIDGRWYITEVLSDKKPESGISGNTDTKQENQDSDTVTESNITDDDDITDIFEDSGAENTEPVQLTDTALSGAVSEEVKELAEKIASNLKEHKSEMTFYDFTYDKQVMTEAILYLRMMYPEIFWFTGGYNSTSFSDGKFELKLNTLEGYSMDEFIAMEAELNKQIDYVLSQVPSDADDYEKALYINDYLVNNTVYDKVEDITGTVYGCLVQHQARCAGYAYAFQLFMNRLGIECGYVTGFAGENHAWNYVKIDGNYYWVDATWNDPVTSDADNNNTTHGYFLIDDERLYNSRTNDNENLYVPVCSSMNANYYVKNGLYIESYDADSTADIIQKNMSSGSVEIMFSSAEDMNMAIKELIDESLIRIKVPAVSNNGYNYNYNDEVYTLKISVTE